MHCLIQYFERLSFCQGQEIADGKQFDRPQKITYAFLISARDTLHEAALSSIDALGRYF